MRNRTELVTTTVEGSENEESGADDSGEDWQPEKVIFRIQFQLCNGDAEITFSAFSFIM